MKISQTSRTAAEKFLDSALAAGQCDPETAGNLKQVLLEPYTFWHAAPKAHAALWQDVRQRFGGGKRAAASSGVEGRLDTLLSALYVFTILFTVIAVLPVLLLYQVNILLLPVIFFSPLLHLYASRVVARLMGGLEQAASLHAAAAVCSVVSLTALYDVLEAFFHYGRIRFVSGAAVPVLWIVWAAVTAWAVPSEKTRITALWTAGVSVIFALLCMLHSFEAFPASAAAAGILTMLFALLSHQELGYFSPRARRHFRHAAPFAMAGAFLLARLSWISSEFRPAAMMPAAFVVWLLTFPVPALLIRWDAAGPGTPAEKIHRAVNIAAVWTFMALSLHGPAGGGSPMHGWQAKVFLAGILVLPASWAVLTLRVQFRDRSSFDDMLYGISAVTAVFWGLGICIALLYHGYWLPVLLLSGGLLWMTQPERRARLLGLPEEAPAEAAEKEPDAEEGTG